MTPPPLPAQRIGELQPQLQAKNNATSAQIILEFNLFNNLINKISAHKTVPNDFKLELSFRIENIDTNFDEFKTESDNITEQ